MVKLDTTVKFFYLGQSGAPTLSVSRNCIKNILTNCLVNGFGTVELTGLSVTSEVATATVGSGHGFIMSGNTGPVILISGCEDNNLNTEWRINVVDATTFTFICPGIADGAKSGTITAKMAPAGWSLVWEDVNNYMFALRPNDATWCGATLWVSQTSNSGGTWDAYLSFDDGTGVGSVGMFLPSTYRFFFASDGSNNSGYLWQLIADPKFFYAFWRTNSNGVIGGAMVFGEYAYPFVSTDQFPLFIAPGTPNTTNAVSPFSSNTVNSNGSHRIARNYLNSVDSPQNAGMFSHGRGREGGYYPAVGGDTGLIISPIEVWQSTYYPRGVMPGAYVPITSTSGLNNNSVQGLFTNLPDKELVVCEQNSVKYLFDITGPWR